MQGMTVYTDLYMCCTKTSGILRSGPFNNPSTCVELLALPSLNAEPMLLLSWPYPCRTSAMVCKGLASVKRGQAGKRPQLKDFSASRTRVANQMGLILSSPSPSCQQKRVTQLFVQTNIKRRVGLVIVSLHFTTLQLEMSRPPTHHFGASSGSSPTWDAKTVMETGNYRKTLLTGLISYLSNTEGTGFWVGDEANLGLQLISFPEGNLSRRELPIRPLQGIPI